MEKQKYLQVDGETEGFRDIEMLRQIPGNLNRIFPTLYILLCLQDIGKCRKLWC